MSTEFLQILKPLIHYGMHFLAPGLIAYLFFRKEWKKAWVLMLLTMLVDLDHLLANPIFDPHRCSINFHPLHTYWAIGVYVIMTFFKKTRIVGIGLVFHMITDFLDCWMR